MNLDNATRGEDHSHPMTFVQELIWLEDQKHPDSCRYLENWIHKIKGPIDVYSVHAAPNRTIARHASPRNRLFLFGDEPIRMPLRSAIIPLEVRDGNPEDLQEMLRQTLNHPSDLNELPLLRAFLPRIADDESVPAIALHHTVADCHSLNIFTQEFGRGAVPC
ncbi:condensation domain-containing protein [Streptomyces atratus]|nr:condensation domain-containing protein [Streptomyces atratus]